MNSNLIYAKDLLIKKGHTLVLYDGNETITYFKRGIKPLLELYEQRGRCAGFVAADKVIGKAAAFMYVLLEIKEIYTNTISEGALEVFKAYGIDVYYENCSPFIINRTGTDICPMEKSVLDVKTPKEAFFKICEALNNLSKG